MYTIGIDIGGTHTDAVLVDLNQKIIKFCKTETTSPLEIGVETALKNIIADPTMIKAVFLGTTHATNSILEGKDLYKVGLIRIAGHSPESLRPCFGWPQQLYERIFVGTETINGGYECDGREINAFKCDRAQEAFQRLLEKGMESLAIVGVFSPIQSDHEKMCRELIPKGFPVSLSHEIGGVGFIERENATVLNAALKRPMDKCFRNLKIVLKKLSIDCPLHITQNNGSIISIDEAIHFPLLTISSGPTNSFIGGSKLCGLDNAVIVDIGGTSTDIGVVLNGYPRRSIKNCKIGGITLNYRNPDVLALSIGGGTYVHKNRFGPDSCGKNIRQQAQVFGGTQLTLTDICCKIGLMDFLEGNNSQIQVNQVEAKEIHAQVLQQIHKGITLMKGDKASLPVITVGGGAPIVGRNNIQPPFGNVANAYGAALAEFSGTVDTVVNLVDRQNVLAELKEKALAIAIKKGAKPSECCIVDVQVTPYHYMPNNLARVIVVASG